MYGRKFVATLLLGLAAYAVIAAAFVYPAMDTIVNAFIGLAIAVIFGAAFLANVFCPQSAGEEPGAGPPVDEETDLFD